jgi:hypothetical protein
MENKEQKAIDEALEVISDGRTEISEVKKVLFDKRNTQYSIKIPKSLALKAGLDENSEFNIIINPKEETIKNISSSIIIFKRGDKDGEGKKGA